MANLIRLSAACFSAAMALAAWPQTAPEKPTTSLEGKVVSQPGGAPLKKTSLLLRPVAEGKALTAESDDKGAFSFPTVEPGRYTLMGERAGYARQPYGARGKSSTGTELTLTAGRRMKDLVFPLIANAVISGKVLDEDGDPMSNTAVLLLRPGYQRGRKQYATAGSAMAGATGEYSISVVPGRYLLAAASMGSLAAGQAGATSKPPSDQPEPAYTTLFYPGSRDEAGALPVDAAAGADLRGMDFHLSKVPAYRVRGKLALAQPSKNSVVMLTPQASSVSEAMAPRMARPQTDGSFEFVGVTPGQWLLRAASDNNVTTEALTVTDRHIEGLLVQLAPLREVAGTAVVAGDTPVSLKSAQITLEAMDSNNLARALVGEDGKFTVRNLLPGRYRVLLSGAPGDAYVQSIRHGGHDVTDDGLDLNATTGTLEIRLSPDGAEIAGQVADGDGKPMPGVTVALVPASRLYPLFQSAATDQAGSFQFRGVPPGDYKLLAWEDVVTGAWYDPDFLKPVEGRAQSLTVNEKDRASVVLKAIPPETRK